MGESISSVNTHVRLHRDRFDPERYTNAAISACSNVQGRSGRDPRIVSVGARWLFSFAPCAATIRRHCDYNNIRYLSMYAPWRALPLTDDFHGERFDFISVRERATFF